MTEKRRRILTARSRQELLDKYGNACSLCGATDVPLEISHIIPISRGGSDDLENLIVLCPNCHYGIDTFRPNELEFTNFLVSLMNEHDDFRMVRTEARMKGTPIIWADIVAEKRSGNKWSSVLVECKNYTFFTKRRLLETITQIRAYLKRTMYDVYALAFPGRLSEGDRSLLLEHDIEPWDIDYIARTFSSQLETSEHPYFKPLFLSVLAQTAETTHRRLLRDLQSCVPGKANWITFQRLIGQVFEHLFCPPLEAPISESSDLYNINRRDWILPNYASDGFWKFLRDMYRADYVVVDAKNHKGKLKKKEVLQVANYLKPHGAGLFGIIVCRNGGDGGCNLTLREQWMVHRKMVILLADRDIESMLLSASSGGSPEKVIGRAIEEFRLSM